ncbi:hypothetical protein PENTCL1PPCAC_17535 [Pristionchus entomophagus]|uniref:G protein-coupled receptor n=1 Tax=Pristionchus entomophagus TaxID=358040 RepID=A0AAV5TLP4_9BILA|nr:hypothetical protein PENTCL1PPCAC_17535 [Pristionchus entomophagus]
MSSIIDWISQHRHSNYTVSSELEEFFTAYHRFIGIVSISANSLHLYLIIEASQFYTRGYRFSLFLLQVWFIALNIHLSLFSIPFPLYPLFGAYSRGLLGTHFNVSFHYQMTILIFIVDECIASLLMCSLFRQQSLILGGRLKLTNSQLVFLILALHLALVTNAAIFVFIDIDLDDQLDLLATKYPGLEWISSHGFVWAVYAWNSGSFFFLLSIFFQCLIIGSFAAMVVRYTIMTVRRQRRIIAKRKDERLKKKVRRVDTLVISQSETPIP